MKAIVIGSGVAGLTAALTLLRDGHEVEIFEQANKPGGVTAGLESHGFHWDYGQLIVEGLADNEPSGRVLDELGVLEHLQTVPEDREYVFPDFRIRVPEAYAGVKWRIELLKTLFPEDAAGLERYWRDFIRFTRLVTLGGRLEKGGLGDKLAFYAALLPFITRKDWSAERLMDSYFKSEKLQAVFISILADFFTPPSQFMGLGVFALNSEVSFEKRMPAHLARNAEMTTMHSIIGGTEALTRAYVEQIETAGGKLHTGRAVTRITTADGRVTGVVDAKGARHDCDLVMASGGAKETLLGLLDKGTLPAEFAEKVAGIPLMDSVFMLHLGVDYDPAQTLRTACTYFYGSYDIEGEVERARQGIYHEGTAGFVIHWPTLRSPGMAPKGKHALTIYTICPDRLTQGDWEKDKKKFADKLLDCAEVHLPGLRQHIVAQQIVTPPDFRKLTHLEHHAFGGIAPLLGAWKVPHQTPVAGLWFIGAQSESGGGVNAVIPAAWRAAKKAGGGG